MMFRIALWPCNFWQPCSTISVYKRSIKLVYSDAVYCECEKTCCCGNCSVHKFIRNALIPGSASYSCNWLPPMFLTILSFHADITERKTSLVLSPLISVCYLIRSFYILSSVKGNLKVFTEWRFLGLF